MHKLRSIELPLTQRTIPSLLALRACDSGDRTCLIFEGQRYTYAEVDKLTNRLANGFMQAGIKRGDHVAVLLENSPETLWAYFSLGKLGAVAVPINVAAKGELLIRNFVQSECTSLIVESSLLERYEAISQSVTKISHLYITDLDSEGIAATSARFGLPAFGWSELLQGNADALNVTVKCSDSFLLLYTSGTTGPSKGSLSSHAYPITYGLQRAEAFGYWPEDILYTCLPLFHGNALIGTCFSALVSGAAIALSRRFSVSMFWSEVKTMGATQVNLLGVMANFLWKQEPSPHDRDHSIRQCTMVPLPEFGAEFEKRFGLQLTSVYALSDYGMGTILGPDHPASKKGSAGLPAPDVDVAILDDDDLPLEIKQIGEIALRAKIPWTTGQEYWKMPNETVAARRNLWFHTGDRGYLDDDGYLYFVDRKKDAIRRRGENISSWEIEQIIQRHPEVLEVAAFPIKGESEDEVMVSVVCRQDNLLTHEELIFYCRDNMAYFMVPRYVDLVKNLPKTLSEKIEKYKLKAEAESRLSEIWDREAVGIVIKR